MKTGTVRILIVTVIAVALIAAPLYFTAVKCSEINMHNKILNDVRYLDEPNMAIYSFQNREVAEKACAELLETGNFTKYAVIRDEYTFDEFYISSSFPDITYKSFMTTGGTEKRVARINNLEYKMIKDGHSIESYQLTPEFAEMGLVKLIEGRMLDFHRKNKHRIL